MNSLKVPSELFSRVRNARSIAVITGAGMSAESGVPTFRDASSSLWASVDPMEMASPEGWRKDRARVWAWYEWRRGLVTKAQPNAGHIAIARLATTMRLTSHQDTALSVITQNVDDLHERGGFHGALHVHGSLFSPRCGTCGKAAVFAGEPSLEPIERIDPPQCTICGGYVRPGVVWFGENLDVQLMGRAMRCVQNCDVLLVVGTSGVVRPVSDLPRMARERGAWVCEINPNPSDISSVAHLCWQGTAAQTLPALANSIAAR